MPAQRLNKEAIRSNVSSLPCSPPCLPSRAIAVPRLKKTSDTGKKGERRLRENEGESDRRKEAEMSRENEGEEQPGSKRPLMDDPGNYLRTFPRSLLLRRCALPTRSFFPLVPRLLFFLRLHLLLLRDSFFYRLFPRCHFWPSRAATRSRWMRNHPRCNH